MWQSLLVYNACPQPQTEATVLVSPSLLQIDTFGKWCRCLHNVCYVKLKKRRYLDKCRLSAPAGISDRDKLTLVTTDRPFSYGVNAAHLTLIARGTFFASLSFLAHFKVNFFSRSNFPFSLVFVFLQLQPLGFPFIAVIEAT